MGIDKDLGLWSPWEGCLTMEVADLGERSVQEVRSQIMGSGPMWTHEPGRS